MSFLISRSRDVFSKAAGPPLIGGDSGFANDPFSKDLTTAAVLVPIISHPEPSILLTTRSAHLSEHAGQVAFPGGRVEAQDRSVVEAALREANEEIGLPVDKVDVVGVQSPYLTGSGYTVSPVVGIVPAGLSYQADPGEVANIFEVPLKFLFNPDNYEAREVFYKGRNRRYYAADWEGHNIWGATAGMLLNLAVRFHAKP